MPTSTRPAAQRRGYSRDFTPSDPATAKRYTIDNIPGGLWIRANAKAKRDGLSMRALLLQLLTHYVDDDTTATTRAAAPVLLAAVQATSADLDAASHNRKPPVHPIKLAEQYRSALAKAEGVTQ